ncbi:MAG: protein kinase [Chitinivibrionales bacterium]|nr:protein kinase [Chitinivibrionales bacterium]MBD3394600.1 protein kinase [Chitinivibrionales bacterium]
MRAGNMSSANAITARHPAQRRGRSCARWRKNHSDMKWLNVQKRKGRPAMEGPAGGEPWSGQIWNAEPISEQVRKLEQSGATWIHKPVDEIPDLAAGAGASVEQAVENARPGENGEWAPSGSVDVTLNEADIAEKIPEGSKKPLETACTTGGSSAIAPPSTPTPSSGYPRLPGDGEKVELGTGATVAMIGQGGMGRIYKIWNEQLEVHRAVKVLLLPEGTDNKEAIELLKRRYEMEAKIVAQLHHPNIVEIHNLGEWNGLPYIEMEFVDGIDIKRLIRHGIPIPVNASCAIALLACRGLAHAHHQEYQLYGKSYQGIVHRDLKPENLMITRRGSVKILDFGIARPDIGVFHTVQGHFAGSLQYAAPEQIDNGDIDRRTDIYAFGLIMYEMLTGRMAFPIYNMTELLAARLRNDYPPIQRVNRSLPGNLCRIIEKCLKSRMADRFSTADDLLAALEDIAGRTIRGTPESLIRDFFQSVKVRTLYDEPHSSVHFPPAAGARSTTRKALTRLFHFLGKRR